MTTGQNINMFVCKACKSSFAVKADLNVHTLSSLDCVKLSLYSCDECGHMAKTKFSARIHRESKHEGVIYTCEDCGHKAKLKGSAKHTGNLNIMESYLFVLCVDFGQHPKQVFLIISYTMGSLQVRPMFIQDEN